MARPSARRIQHDLHLGLCGCGREHLAVRPAGVPDAPVSIGPDLRALAVYLVVFQHVPAGQCRDLIAEVTGAAVSAGFIHSCLRAAADLAAGVITLIAAPIIAARVAGFDETTLRAGPAGSKKYVPGAFTGQYSLLFPGARTLESFRDFGILPAFGAVVVSDRYQNYFHPDWKHIAGHQARCSHLLRDFQDAAETYTEAIWPAQAQRALRGLIRRGTTPASTAWPASPPRPRTRWPWSSAAPSQGECLPLVLAGWPVPPTARLSSRPCSAAGWHADRRQCRHRPAGAADTRSGRRSLANEAAVVLLPDGRTPYAKMPSTCV